MELCYIECYIYYIECSESRLYATESFYGDSDKHLVACNGDSDIRLYGHSRVCDSDIRLRHLNIGVSHALAICVYTHIHAYHAPICVCLRYTREGVQSPIHATSCLSQSP